MSSTHYKFCMFIVSGEKQYWKDFSKVVDEVVAPKTRPLLLQQRIHAEWATLGEPLQCLGCKDRLERAADKHCIMTMIHTDHSGAVEVQWITVTIACRKEGCSPKALEVASQKWKEYRKILDASGRTHMIRSCAQCHSIETERQYNVCSRCKSVHYCSTKCQKAAWDSHQRYCFDASKKKK